MTTILDGGIQGHICPKKHEGRIFLVHWNDYRPIQEGRQTFLMMQSVLFIHRKPTKSMIMMMKITCGNGEGGKNDRI